MTELEDLHRVLHPIVIAGDRESATAAVDLLIARMKQSLIEKGLDPNRYLHPDAMRTMAEQARYAYRLQTPPTLRLVHSDASVQKLSRPKPALSLIVRPSSPSSSSPPAAP